MYKNLKTRDAVFDDAKIVYKWRFSTNVVSNSWSKDVPSFVNHQRFFKNHLSCYSIIVLDNKDIGFIRDMDGDISIVIDECYRNNGIGSYLLKQYVGRAEVKLDNVRSFYAFLNAGFKPVGWVMKK